MSRSSLRRRFVRGVYADQNDSPAVKHALRPLLERLESGRGVNIGGGPSRLDPRLLHVDVFVGPPVDVAASAVDLPFPSNVFDLVVSQETVEHVPDPFAAVREMVRTLRPGGRIYLQVPFVIGYHPGPEDYWRFTRTGLGALVRQAGIEPDQIGISVGGGTGFYRIAVEFLAGLGGRLASFLYLPAKAGAAVLCYPLKWFDGWLSAGPGRDRIPGGYFAVGTKRDDRS